MRLWGASLIVLGLSVGSAAQAQSSASAFTTGYRYDAGRRVVGSIAPDPDGAGALRYQAVRNSYDAAGRLTRVETGELANWQAESTLPANWSGFTIYRRVDYGYDSLGRKIRETVTDAQGNATRSVTQYSYEDLDKLQCTAVRMAGAFGTTSGACSQVASGDRITRNFYDDAGQLVQERRGVGSGLEQAYATYEYTPNGKRKTVIDANGNKASLEYDGHDRQQRWRFPSTTKPSSFNGATAATALSSAGSVSGSDYEEYGYDANGNRTSLRKRDTRTISYAFDAANRMQSKTYPNGGGGARAVYYGYDLRGLQTVARFDSVNGTDLVSSGWDGFGRQISSTTSMSGTSRMLTHAFDADGNRTRVTWPDNNRVDYGYDGMNRQQSATVNGTDTIAGMTYDGGGRLWTLTRGVGSTVYGYEGSGRLTSLDQRLSGSASTTNTTFGYNGAGQIDTRTQSNDTLRFSRNLNLSMSYDSNGLNQYSAVAGSANSYDANGNLTGDGAGATYSYDIENRLVTGPNGVQLTWDPLGRLYQSVGNQEGTIQFLYDNDQLTAEYNSSGTLLRRYAHGAGEDDPLVWFEGAGVDSSTRRFLFADHQGSIVAVTNSSGGTVGINAYNEYGIPNTGNIGRFRYTGQAWIQDLAMYHYKARVYSPMLGRFLQTDPIGYDDQVNLYAYVGNDPVNGRDPSGSTTMNCAYNQESGQGSCQSTDDGKRDLTLTTSVTDKNGSTRTATNTYSAAYVARVGSVGSFVNAQYRSALNVNIGVKTDTLSSAISSLASQIGAALGVGRASGPVYGNEGQARRAAQANGWRETSMLSPDGKGKFYRDESGYLWTRDRDGHNGGAWKMYDRSGAKRLGTYDEGLNRIRK